MLFSYFSEQPYTALDDADADEVHDFDNPARQPGANTLLHSNRFFDAEIGSKLYQQRIAEYKLVEEVGFDGIMLNEHHNVGFCMQPRCNIMATVLAAVTERIKIIQLGNPLPTWDNPIQLAEESAMIDMISKGRLVAGFVRGGGQEQIANNVNPAFNRDRMQEAHDLIVEAWTRPGPFRWEGDQYQVRVVNPWALPLQKPHPRVFIPGVSSKETVLFAAEHGYPYVCLSTSIDQTKQIWETWEKGAAEHGFSGGPPYRGYMTRCQVAATEKDAIEAGREHMWMNREGNPYVGQGHPVWSSPAGYNSWEGRKLRMQFFKKGMLGFDEQRAAGLLICGTPGQAIDQLKVWLEETRPGMLYFLSNDGRVTPDQATEHITLMGREVLPALREIAKKLNLLSPFEADTPVSWQHARALQAAA